MTTPFRLSKLALNAAAVSEGIWVDAGAGLRLKIARISSPKFENWVRSTLNPNDRRARNILSGASRTDEVTDKDMIPGVARYILLGWENLVDDQNQPILYSPEKAAELLTEYSELYRIVLDYASRYEGYRQEDMEAAAGN